MGTSIYITSSEGHSGKSAVALGVVNALSRSIGRVGVFRPIVQSAEVRDDILELLLSQLDPQNRGPEYESGFGVTYDDVHADPDEALSRIVTRYRALERRCDTVVIVGSDFTDVGNPAELGFNARVAANLGAPVLLVLTGLDADKGQPRTPEQLAQALEVTLPELDAAHATLLAITINRADENATDEVRLAVAERALRELGHKVPVWAIPETPLLMAPSLSQLLDAVGGELVYGDRELLGREVLGIVLAGMSMQNVLERLKEGAVVVIAADRTEVLLAVLLAQRAETFPSLTGIVVNGPFEFPPAIERLINGLNVEVPIIRTNFGTYDTAQRIMQTRGRLAAAGISRRKIDLALAKFEQHIPAIEVVALLNVKQSLVVTPLMFENTLLDRARSDRKHIVLPEGSDDRILVAAGSLLAREVAEITILGEESEVRGRASALGVDISAAHVLSTSNPDYVARFAEEYARLRSHKGVTIEAATERVRDVSYFGTLMVHLGLADGMVSGAAHTTAHTIRPGFEIVKTKAGVSVVSSVFLMALADRVLVYGDCAVNPDPTAEQLADIAISSAETASQFDIAPRVAMLSYSTGESGSGADVDKVRTATGIVRERMPELLVEGPIQYDAATDAAVASKKMPGSQVAGRATVFIFPDLNTGNNTYKAVQRSAGAVAIGPILQGLNKPINDLSRGALVSDIINTVAITAIQAQGS
ncbi:phosphate acetyltransferase [Pseudoclavibacter sp. JSM 162008]|uniref:phosphate acetyltransferase n=1 Tax=Pseudoclavibacter sp. JSM 162008 TaxID=3229855 RepID=UPI003524D4D6